VFGIGFHKTGTSSLAAALKVLGYRVTGPNGVQDPDIGSKQLDLALALAPRFDAFRGNPWSRLYREMDEHYPGSKFVLTVRPMDTWLRSALHYFGEKSTPMRVVIYGEGSPVGNEDLYVRVHQQHIDDVHAYFADRPDDLLTMSITEGDGWEQLCPFLGVGIPDEPFPHSNVTAEQGGRRRRLS
jgi:hypothetical protein